MPHGFEDAGDLGGEVTVEHSQSSVIQQISAELEQAGQEDPSVKHGLCMGYSAVWIAKNAKGQDFWQYVGSATARADLRQMAHGEHLISRMHKAVSLEKMTEDQKKIALEAQEKWSQKYILKSAEGAVSAPDHYEGKGRPDVETLDLCDRLTQGDGYKLLCLRGTTKGSHAVAVSVSGGKVTYMDPNGGEVKFKTADEFNWWFLMKHLPTYKFANFTSFYIDSYSAPINAAEAVKGYTESKSVDLLPTATRQPAAPTTYRGRNVRIGQSRPGGQASVSSTSSH